MSAYKERQTRIYLTQAQRDKVEDLSEASGLPFSRIVGGLLDYALDHVEFRQRVVYDICFDDERRPGETFARYMAETPYQLGGRKKSTTSAATLIVDNED